MLAGRHIVLGVSGGVAAYKAAYLARRLIESGAKVRVVMTESATRFVGEATFGAITGEPPTVSLFDAEDVSPHTSLARWADAMVIAPATASTMARIATGQSSDALSATVLATTAPVLIAPAMHSEMWEHPATSRNLATLRSDGYVIVGPGTGDLAGGDVGIGRLAEPDDIVEAIEALFKPGEMTGMRVLVTSGGTREPIDPVRYIGNRSSGKMGNALAAEAARRGATVCLITSATPVDHPLIELVPVETAGEMAEAVWSRLDGCDIAILAAAVADFRPSDPKESKLRRSDGPPSIDLEPTPDILGGVVESGAVAFVVGFAAESGSLERAPSKAADKGVDLLVANDVAKHGSGFGSDTNEVTLIDRDGSSTALPLMTKARVASAILDAVLERTA
jgi:phosphopantothenoylcysteine decarboxylase / phosphopantothenate---cysteine ligase